jgi:hypothetical protein
VPWHRAPGRSQGGELFASLYHNLGIDSHRATLSVLTGRPKYLAEDDANPLAELV